MVGDRLKKRDILQKILEEWSPLLDTGLPIRESDACLPHGRATGHPNTERPPTGIPAHRQKPEVVAKEQSNCLRQLVLRPLKG